MPESVRDRCTKAHEYLFLLSKKPKYFYDQEAVREKAGRNRRSVWTISTQPYSEAHFATYPEKLVEPCIKAGCPKEVCKACGKPRERIVENNRKATRPGLDSKVQSIKNKHRLATKQSSKSTLASFVGNRDLYRHVTETTTVGFTDCGCNAGFRHGIVLDPFGGSGTTGVVAARLKRDYVLIELSENYIETIAKPRLASVELCVPVHEARAGQRSLFDEQQPKTEEINRLKAEPEKPLIERS